MAAEYTAFKHAIFEAAVEKELKKAHVFVDGCEQKWTGKLKKQGDKVTIHTMGDVTIKDLAYNSIYSDIEAAEHLSTDDLEIVIDQVAYFNVEVSDIDEVQSDTPIFNEFKDSAAYGFNDKEDAFVAGFANQAGLTRLTTVTKLTSTNVIDIILAARAELKRNNVPASAKLEMIIPPEFESIIIKAGIMTDTNNSEVLKNGAIGKVLGVLIKVSNNVAKNTETIDGDNLAGSLDMIQFRVRNRACAFAEQLMEFQYYEPQTKVVVNALKGCILFGGKVLRPAEIVIIPVKEYEQYTVVPA